MSTNSFAAAFDAIELDPARGPAPAAIEAAMAMCAPQDEPGFYLLDDCGGRFVVDREFGFISVKDDLTLELERGEIRCVRLKVIEASGERYELALRLLVNGPVPHVVSDREESAPLIAPETPAAPRAYEFRCFDGESAPALIGDERAPYGAPLWPLASTRSVEVIDLSFAAVLPQPSPAHAAWTYEGAV